MVVVLKAFVERSVSLVLTHPFEFSWLGVSQTYVFRCSSPPGGSQPSIARWIVHPIVLAHRKNRRPRRIVFRAAKTEQFGCFRRQEPSQGRLPGKAAIRPSDEKPVSTKPPPPPFSRGLRDSLPLFYAQLLAHDDHQSFSFLFRLRQPRNNCSKFIEYLVPAL